MANLVNKLYRLLELHNKNTWWFTKEQKEWSKLKKEIIEVLEKHETEKNNEVVKTE